MRKGCCFLTFFWGGAWRFLEVLGVNSLDIQNHPVIPGDVRCEFGTPNLKHPQEMFGGLSTEPQKV